LADKKTQNLRPIYMQFNFIVVIFTFLFAIISGYHRKDINIISFSLVSIFIFLIYFIGSKNRFLMFFIGNFRIKGDTETKSDYKILYSYFLILAIVFIITFFMLLINNHILNFFSSFIFLPIFNIINQITVVSLFVPGLSFIVAGASLSELSFSHSNALGGEDDKNTMRLSAQKYYLATIYAIFMLVFTVFIFSLVKWTDLTKNTLSNALYFNPLSFGIVYFEFIVLTIFIFFYILMFLTSLRFLIGGLRLSIRGIVDFD
jgi:hypothetical protein